MNLNVYKRTYGLGFKCEYSSTLYSQIELLLSFTYMFVGYKFIIPFYPLGSGYNNNKYNQQ